MGQQTYALRRQKGSAPQWRRPVAWALVITLVGLVLAGCGSGSGPVAVVRGGGPTGGLHGVAPDPPSAKPALVLTDTAAQPFDLTRQTAGTLTYLYFGYTHCPDVCPTTMADLAIALRRQPAAVRRQIRVVFVTTDPRRDTPAVLRTWLDRFDPSFIGLTGSPAQLVAAQKAAGVPVAEEEKDPKLGYTIGHSAEVLAFSRDNKAHVIYLAGNTIDDYARDMPTLLHRWT